MRLAQVKQDAGRRPIAPRTHGVQVSLEMWVVEPGRNPRTTELGGPVRVQHLHHHHSHAYRVHPTPRLRSKTQQPELHRQGIRSFAFRDEEVYAARIVVHPRSIGRRQIHIHAPRRIPELEHALRLIVLEQRSAHDLRQLAVGIAPVCVHLPEPVLRGYVTLGHEEIILACRRDMRNPVAVAPHLDRRRESGYVHVPIQRRERGLRGKAQPQHAHTNGQQG